MSNTWIFAIGFIAQGLFSARLIVQWIKSENAGKVTSPVLFWQLSLVASFLLMVYGVLRNDIVIIGGQLISYYIYIRNLKLKESWDVIPGWFRSLAVFAPFLLMTILFLYNNFTLNPLFNNPGITLSLMIFGTLGQILFTFRFVYQWIFSERIKDSILPPGFWIISLCGAIMIIIYGIFRADPVLIVGHLFGSAIYSRNLYLNYRRMDK